MKNQCFYLYLSVLLLSFMAQTDAYAQDCTILDPPSSCTDIDTITLSVNNGVITVDEAFIANTLGDIDANAHVQLVIPAGEHTAASFENLNFCRTTIRIANSGEATFAGYNRDNGETRAPTIEILNCHNLELDGHGITVLDAYGDGVKNGQNESAVYIGEASTFIEVHHLDIQNPSGFAGIMAKDSPVVKVILWLI